MILFNEQKFTFFYLKWHWYIAICSRCEPSDHPSASCCTCAAAMTSGHVVLFGAGNVGDVLNGDTVSPLSDEYLPPGMTVGRLPPLLLSTGTLSISM